MSVRRLASVAVQLLRHADLPEHVRSLTRAAERAPWQTNKRKHRHRLRRRLRRHAKQRTVEDEQARMMQVTSFRGWLSLCVVGAVLVGVIVWGVVGSIPERIEGQGIVIRGGRPAAAAGERRRHADQADDQDRRQRQGRAADRRNLAGRQQRGDQDGAAEPGSGAARVRDLQSGGRSDGGGFRAQISGADADKQTTRCCCCRNDGGGYAAAGESEPRPDRPRRVEQAGTRRGQLRVADHTPRMRRSRA